MQQLRQAAEYAAAHDCAIALAPARPNLQIFVYKGDRQVSRILTWLEIESAQFPILLTVVEFMCNELVAAEAAA